MTKKSYLLIAAASGVLALAVAACASAQSGGPAQTAAPSASAPSQAAVTASAPAPAAAAPAPAAAAPAAAAPADQTAAKPAAEGAPAAQKKDAALTDDETKQAISLLQNRCTVCHDASTITSLNQDKAAWIGVLDGAGMATNASLTPDEESLILRYLVANYGPK